MLQVIPRTGEGRLISSGSNNSDTTPVKDFNSIPIDAQVITGLQLRASFGQTKDTSPTNILELTNMSDSQVSKLRKDDTVIMRAGYSEETGNFVQTSEEGVSRRQHPDLFVGQIIQVSTKHTDRDKITKILCGEAATIRKNSKVSKSWLPSTTRLKVLTDLAYLVKTQGMPIGSIRLPDSQFEEYKLLQKPFLTGYVAKGYLLDEIETLCQSLKMRSFTALGKLYIEPAKRSSLKSFVIKFPDSPGSNEAIEVPVQTSRLTVNVTPEDVKGTVEFLDDNAVGLSNANGSDNKRGISLTTFLDGRLSVNMICLLEGFNNPEINGYYETTSVNHKLDYRGSDWDTDLTLRRI